MTGRITTKNRSFWSYHDQTPADDIDDSLLLAEQLDAVVASENMRDFSEVRTPNGLVHSSWRMIEYALARASPIDHDIRKLYISDYAQQLLADVLAMSKEGNPLHRYTPDYRSTPQQNHFHQALLLGAFAPLFSKRATQTPINRDDCRNLHTSMQQILNEELYAGNPTQEARLSENVTTMLSTRTGQPEYILYPASPREENGSKQKYNHDRYFMHDGEKIPVQIKIGGTALRYARSIAVLDIEGMLSFAARRAGIATQPQPHADLIPHVRQAAELLTSENSGDFLYPGERTFLNIASQAIVSIYKKAGIDADAA